MLIAGLNAHICDHCVTQAQLIISEELTTKTQESFSMGELLKPAEIKAYLEKGAFRCRL